VLTSTLVSGPQAQTVALQKAGPKMHMVTIATDPSGAEIYEGARLIGKSPKVWTEATEGEHELTLQHDGYHEEKGKIVIAKDGDEFNFKLKKIESAKKPPQPDLGIKAER
jgi:hypothetical protein